MVKEFAAVHNTAQIKKLLTVLGRDFASSKSPNYKKGGLIGLAAMAVALGKVHRYLILNRTKYENPTHTYTAFLGQCRLHRRLGHAYSRQFQRF